MRTAKNASMEPDAKYQPMGSLSPTTEELSLALWKTAANVSSKTQLSNAFTVLSDSSFMKINAFSVRTQVVRHVIPLIEFFAWLAKLDIIWQPIEIVYSAVSKIVFSVQIPTPVVYAAKTKSKMKICWQGTLFRVHNVWNAMILTA